MALTPGSKNKLNILSGFGNTVHITEEDKLRYASVVYPTGTVFSDDNGFLYHADGVKNLQNILEDPILDKNVPVLSEAERERISSANEANGFVFTDGENKIDDDFLRMVADGKIDDTYLSKYVDRGMIKLEVIPTVIRNHMKFVQTYESLQDLDTEYRKGLVFVIDASGDPTVEKGWAMYVYRTDVEKWLKVQEGSGIDYDYNSLVSHGSVEHAGAIMYDHTVHIVGGTLDQLGDLEYVPPPIEIIPSEFVATNGWNLICRSGNGKFASRLALTDGTEGHTLTVSTENCTVHIADTDIADSEESFIGTIDKLNGYLENASVTTEFGDKAKITIGIDDNATDTCYPLRVDDSDPVFAPESNIAAVSMPEHPTPYTGLKFVAAPGNKESFSVTFTSTRWSFLELPEEAGGDGSIGDITLEGTVDEINEQLSHGLLVRSLNKASHAVVITDSEPLRTIGTFEVDYNGVIEFPFFRDHVPSVEVSKSEPKHYHLAHLQGTNEGVGENVTIYFFLTVTGDVTVTNFPETGNVVTASSGQVKMPNAKPDIINDALDKLVISIGPNGGTVKLSIANILTETTQIIPVD